MLGQLVWQGFGFAYGVVNFLAILVVATVRDGAFSKRPSKEENQEIETAQKQYWSVGLSPLPGFEHRFFRLRNGVGMHYVVKTEGVRGKDGSKSPHPQNVAVFIHGFPDSYLLWKKILQTSSLDDQILIAVDLPGYGGSEGLQEYSANEVLEAMTEFILGMREKYLQEEARLVVVTHDWGSAIAARLASEAPQLADRWVITSIAIPQHAYSNATAKLASAKQMLHTYSRQPLRLSLLKNAFKTLQPVLNQLKRSYYIFIFNLPSPLATFAATFGNYYFLHALHRAANKRRPLTPKQAGEAMASSVGPGAPQLDEPNAYPHASALKARLSNNGMREKLRLYREGLARGVWEKSIETVVALSEVQASSTRGSGGAGTGLFDDGPPGALKAPATIIYGLEDPAFEKRLALDGIGDYLARDSQVLALERAGHWLPLEEVGSKVVEEVVVWALEGEQTTKNIAKKVPPCEKPPRIEA
ncbi:alpha/beta-hydrolase [Bimuria novae-zelandiae CBS 107.79]|uniref:Alpha/beta-hydrolase n=1 Tax=Bimuria novae-zelandiae CBS 107.79 TaxID=1447943 RepID=A0A6A5W1S5_9PLEO|nr:alpha/beta-hydrolase [Bimuria novae-zelandiae CBS 107.79]